MSGAILDNTSNFNLRKEKPSKKRALNTCTFCYGLDNFEQLPWGVSTVHGVLCTSMQQLNDCCTTSVLLSQICRIKHQAKHSSEEVQGHAEQLNYSEAYHCSFSFICSDWHWSGQSVHSCNFVFCRVVCYRQQGFFLWFTEVYKYTAAEPWLILLVPRLHEADSPGCFHYNYLKLFIQSALKDSALIFRNFMINNK